MVGSLVYRLLEEAGSSHTMRGLSGGYGSAELQKAGAFRVYEDPADLLRHFDGVGGRL
jgi:hypothetical protein